MLIKLHKVSSKGSGESIIECLINPDYIINVFPIDRTNTAANSFIQIKDRESWNPFNAVEDMETIFKLVNNNHN